MFTKLKKWNHSFKLFMIKRPFLYTLFLLAIFLITQMIINVYRNEPILANFTNNLAIFWILIVGYLASWLSKKQGKQFLICFLFTFTYLMIQSILDKSIVDYTSVLILLFLALLLGGISWMLADTVASRKKELEKSEDESTNS